MENKNKESQDRPIRISPYERLEGRILATGNKWAIENFYATHSRNDGTGR